MNRHTVHIRELPGTNSGWRGAFGRNRPITVHEVRDSDGTVVASFANVLPTPGNRPTHTCAINECRYRNGELPGWAKVRNLPGGLFPSEWGPEGYEIISRLLDAGEISEEDARRMAGTPH